MILPDHPNLLRLRTHTADPVPYILYDSTRVQKKLARYSEREAAATGIFEPQGHKLMERLLGPYTGKLNALVLGCTHYPFMKKAMAKVLGGSVELLDGGAGTARETRRRLLEAGLLNDGRGELVVENSSGDPEKIRLTHRLLEAD